MSAILCIETSTEVCSVAISVNEECVSEKVNYEGPSHASLLAVYIEEILMDAKEKNISIDAVAVSCGPGSYTGLRIGVSTAKGLAYGYGIPLIGINTLDIMASTVKETQSLPENSLLCPMIDARRMEVYTAFYDTQLKKIRDTSADIIDNESYTELLDAQPVYFFGNGTPKCKGTITHRNAIFLDEIFPLAKNMIILAEASLQAKRFEDVAYFEPFYLKDFVATTPKHKIL